MDTAGADDTDAEWHREEIKGIRRREVSANITWWSPGTATASAPPATSTPASSTSVPVPVESGGGVTGLPHATVSHGARATRAAGSSGGGGRGSGEVPRCPAPSSSSRSPLAAPSPNVQSPRPRTRTKQPGRRSASVTAAVQKVTAMVRVKRDAAKAVGILTESTNQELRAEMSTLREKQAVAALSPSRSHSPPPSQWHVRGRSGVQRQQQPKRRRQALGRQLPVSPLARTSRPSAPGSCSQSGSQRPWRRLA